MRRLAPGLALALVACTAAPTQVLVTVDAEPGVRGASQSLGIRIWGRDAAEIFDDEMSLDEQGYEFPWVVALRPQHDDPSRIFRFEATAFAGQNGGGAVVSQTRMTSGYVGGQILHVYLLLQDSCIGVPCEDLSESCRDGRCQEIPVDPPPFTPEAGLPDAGAPPGTDTCDSSMAEACNRLDDDCDGRVDEEFLFASDPSHCGGCDRACFAPNGEAACVEAACEVAACDDGWADCNGLVSDGCETDLTRPAACGACDGACPGDSVCRQIGGEWMCDEDCAVGETNCGGSCVDIRTSTTHCGRCGNPCAGGPNVSSTCEVGRCVTSCDAGFDACDGSMDDADGCETPVHLDASNCGSCGNECDGAQCQTPICMGGECGLMGNTGSSCDTDGRACTLELCSAGTCRLDTDACTLDDGGMSGGDAGLDGGVDAGPDSGVDAGTDAGVDAGTDAGVDAGTDAGVDAGTDAGVDAGMDASFDAGGSCAETGEIWCTGGFCCAGTCCGSECCPSGSTCVSPGFCTSPADASAS